VLSDDQRFELLRRLLHDPGVELRDRVAGTVLFLCGRPLTRIASLQTVAIGVDEGGMTTLRLGRGEIPLPEPLGAIALALRDQRVQQLAGEGWLFGARHAGTHITADRLRCRLKRYGIERSRDGRHGALLALAARVPAPILAERIGIHQARAAQWVRLAGSTYEECVAVRSTRPAPKAPEA
jgi:site-specific recombinase XerC